MTVFLDTETTFVVGTHVYSVRVAAGQSERSLTVTVTVCGQFEWSFEVPGWRPLSFGAGPDMPYLWSAREVIVLPWSFEDDPERIQVDEDLLFAFRVEPGWLLVCETSVRRVALGSETARVELGEVVALAAWDEEALVVRDAVGNECRIYVQGDHLIPDSAG